TRLQKAKQKLKANLSQRKTAIIAAGNTPKIVCGFTDNTGSLRRAVDSIEPSDEEAAMSEAVKLAEELIAGETDSLIIIYTDGCYKDQIAAANRLKFVPIGEPADNTAVTAFQPRRTFDATAGYEILITAENFGTASVESRLEIERKTENGWRIVDVIPVKLEPNVPVTKIVSGISADEETFRVTLPVDDVLPADNTATAVLQKYPKQTVYLFGADNFFLNQVLQVQANVDIKRIQDAKELPAELPENSVLVIHQTVPSILPKGGIWIIDPRSDCNLFKTGAELEKPICVVPDDSQNVLSSIKIQNTVWSGARRVIPAAVKNTSANVQILAQTPDEYPLLLRIGNAFVLTVDLNRGGLVMQTAFPILAANILSALTAQPPPQVSGGNAASRESNLRLADDSFYAQPPADETAGAAAYPLWFYLTLAALALITAEWYLHQRRWID
ncbi:MAG: VWA domain-containing protein, partial [Planctomycetaceae bacterium]|nr:VWA domain-containing protein [Planctomycetaceae bacterium]